LKDWKKAAEETIWLWGTENRTKQEKHGILEKALKEHDEMFDSKFLGIQQFEECFYEILIFE